MKDGGTHINPGIPLSQWDAAAVVQNVPSDVVTHGSCACRSRSGAENKDYLSNMDPVCLSVTESVHDTEVNAGGLKSVRERGRDRERERVHLHISS